MSFPGLWYPYSIVISRDIIIVGSGPSGSSTALHLLKTDPSLAGEILLLDKAVHPREKICAGGLIPHTLDCLKELEIPLSIPHVQVDRAFVRVPPGREVFCEDGGLCSVVRRDEFDYSLAQAACARGAELREGEKVLELIREANGVRVETEKETYRARVVVGADGSGSRVRRHLVGKDTAPVGKALMCDVPVAETTWPGFLQRRYDFNFLPVSQGLKGYLWEFPCLIHGAPHINVGVYSLGDTRLSHTELQQLLAQEITALQVQGVTVNSQQSTVNSQNVVSLDCGPRTVDWRLASLKLRAFPICVYAPQRQLAAPHVVLVGDAAGAEPLMGEGISFALEYGKFAAQQILSAVQSRQFTFSDYTSALAASPIGKKLTRLYYTTRFFYGRTAPFWFALAARSRRLQSVGLKWYNGVEGWHQRNGWKAIWALLRLHT
ncbi:MAG: NAD(P)/FAD-dependent oxidoreductase [Deltaproteobacteria bacterium]|nr:NAD(P)/FAD-dependent oxidoreductase [Deltaproteobacteria bacterium]